MWRGSNHLAVSEEGALPLKTRRACRRLVLAGLISALLGGSGWCYVSVARMRLATLRRSYALRVANAPGDKTLNLSLEKHPLASYMLLPPRNYDPGKSYGLWICLHGNPGRADYGLTEMYYPALRRPVFLLAPQGSTRTKPGSDFSNWNLDKDPAELGQMVDDVCQNFNVDPQHVAIFGSSAGCPFLWKTVSTFPDRFSFIGSYGGGIDVDTLDREALSRAARTAVVYVARGAEDKEFNNFEFVQTRNKLTQLGFHVDANSFPFLGHDGRVFRDRVLSVCDRITLPEFRDGAAMVESISVPLEGKWFGKLTRPLPALENGPGHKDSYPDPGISAEAKAILTSGTVPASWPEVRVPGNWHDWQGQWKSSDGEAVLVRTIEVPPAMAGKDCTLCLGPVSNYDDTYFNGKPVGHTDHTAPYYWVCERRYRVPGKHVRAGKNVISIRIWDGLGGGGLYGGPSEDIRLISLGGRPSKSEIK